MLFPPLLSLPLELFLGRLGIETLPGRRVGGIHPTSWLLGVPGSASYTQYVGQSLRYEHPIYF